MILQVNKVQKILLQILIVNIPRLLFSLQSSSEFKCFNLHLTESIDETLKLGLNKIIRGAISGDDEEAILFIKEGGNDFVEALYQSKLVSYDDYRALQRILGQAIPISPMPSIAFTFEPMPQPSIAPPINGSK